MTNFLNRLADLAVAVGTAISYIPVVFGVGIFTLGMWVGLLFLLTLVGCVKSAPLPAVRIPTLSPGSYDMMWRGGRYTARFYSDGKYECYGSSGHRWAGRWSVDRDSGTLHVGESGVAVDSVEYWPESPFATRWSVKLPAKPDTSIDQPITLRRLP